MARRHYQPTFRRPPAPNALRGLHAAMAALYSDAPLPADQLAQIERECASVPYRDDRQGDLPLALPERPSE